MLLKFMRFDVIMGEKKISSGVFYFIEGINENYGNWNVEVKVIIMLRV